MSERKFKQTFHTRWLSFDGAVESVIENYDALVTCLEMDVAEEDDPTARGLLIFISDYQFLATSYMLRDVLNVLAILSKNFQKKDLDVANMNFQLKSALASIRAMQLAPWPYLKTFFDNLPSDYNEGFEYGSHGIRHRIKCSPSQIEQSTKVKNTYLENVLTNLQDRFPDNGLISCFSIFNPENLPDTDEEMLQYGNDEIHKLAVFYGKEGSPLSVNKMALKTEWSMFKHYLFTKHQGKQFSEFCKQILKSGPIIGTYPNVTKLIKICFILPVSSADCERGFSRYNLIKTKQRNRLDPSTVNLLMTLTIYTPGLDEIESFNFSEAFDIWKKKKARRTSQFFKH